MQLETDFHVWFDNFDLTTIPNVYFTRRKPNADPNLELIKHQPLEREGEIITGSKLQPKIIPFEGFVLALSRPDYEAAMDELKFRISGINRPLIIEQAGSQRQYTATKETFTEQHIERGRASFILDFRCHVPFGRDLAQVVYEQENLTAATEVINHTFEGSAVIRPQVKLTLVDITDGSNKFIKIGNSVTDQGITITRNWVDGDVLLVDSDKKLVYVNEVATDYAGIFPEFKPYQTTLYYSDNFTARDVDVRLQYMKQYL